MNANTELVELARAMAGHRHYVRSVNHFKKFLEREPLLKHLTVANWQRFRDWLHDQKWAKQQQQFTCGRLRILWARAHRAGHAAPLPPKMSGRKPVPAYEPSGELPERSLARFFETVYRVNRLRGKSENPVRLYRF